MQVDRECPACGEPYQANPKRLKFGRETTCSRACSYVFRAAKLRKRKTLHCATCKTEFTRPLSHIKGKHGSQFCSRECHYVGRGLGLSGRVVTTPYSYTPAGLASLRRQGRKLAAHRKANGYRHSKATRAKMSVATTKAIADGHIPKVSQLEDQVATELDRLGIEYARQHFLRDARGRFACSFDFFVRPDTAIEVNGTFWHADPFVYPLGPVSPVQRRNEQAWDRKLSLCRQVNINLVVIWERDIQQSARKAVLTACRHLVA